MRHSPYGSSSNKEAIEAILAALTLDMHVSVVFLDDGVWQLKSDQYPAAIAEKNYTAMLKLLPEYGTVQLFVAKDSLIEHALKRKDLFIAVEELNQSEIAHLLAHQDILLNF